MSELDPPFFSYVLASPADALEVGLFVVAVTAYISRRWIQAAKSPVGFKRRSQLVALTAELLVVGGVIGTVTMAGRISTDVYSRDIVRKQRDAEYEFNVQRRRATELLCNHAGTQPTRSIAARNQACSEIQSAQRDYQVQKVPAFYAQSLQAAGKILFLSADDAAILSNAERTAAEYTAILGKEDVHKYYLDLAARTMTPGLISLIALLVVSGAGLKIGRAAAEVFPTTSKKEAKRDGNASPRTLNDKYLET